ncbi:unnamed protein product, partial [Adineta ricciae]
INTVFNQINLHDYKQLRSLTLIKPCYMTLGSLALSIPYLTKLEHLSIDSHSYPHDFFRLITTTSSSLKACYLPGLEIQDEITFCSNSITCLTITVEDIGLLLNLLAVFPCLTYLHVILRSTLFIDDENFPRMNILSCESLQTLKLHVLERSSIEFREIEKFFQQTTLPQLQTLSYTCTTPSLDHVDAARWNEILSVHLRTIKTWKFFVEIPYNSNSYTSMKQIVENSQTILPSSFTFTLSINYQYYIVHTSIFPKRHFDLSLKSSNSDDYANCDPIHCDSTIKYSNINSLIVDCSSLPNLTTLPKIIQHLHLKGTNNNLVLSKCLKCCSNQLITLKISGLMDDLLCLPNLRQLTIQNTMFKTDMISKLVQFCPRLELLTIEIDSIPDFSDLFNRLQSESQLNELKFLRVYSRDPKHTWTSWSNEGNDLFSNVKVIYETKHLFLFIWF